MKFEKQNQDILPIPNTRYHFSLTSLAQNLGFSCVYHYHGSGKMI